MTPSVAHPGPVRTPLTFAAETAGMDCALIGALEFEFVGTATAQLPESDCVSRFLAAGLEVAVCAEADERFLVVDHRSTPDPLQPARVELWRCLTRAEGGVPHLLVAVDRRTCDREKDAIRTTSLRALVRALSPVG